MPRKSIHLNPMASYFVLVREHERRILRSALDEADRNIPDAADLLGIDEGYYLMRAKLIGGVIGDEPKHEPPGTLSDAWKAARNGAVRRRVDKRRAARERALAAPPEPETPTCCARFTWGDATHEPTCTLYKPDSEETHA